MPVVHLCQWHSSALLQLYSTLLVIFCFFIACTASVTVVHRGHGNSSTLYSYPEKGLRLLVVMANVVQLTILVSQIVLQL